VAQNHHRPLALFSEMEMNAIRVDCPMRDAAGALWSRRDAVFAAAILELVDRIDALAKLDVASYGKVQALGEFSFDLSEKVQQLLTLFILTGRGERASADALEKTM
jgi:hypothetical protein